MLGDCFSVPRTSQVEEAFMFHTPLKTCLVAHVEAVDGVWCKSLR